MTAILNADFRASGLILAAMCIAGFASHPAKFSCADTTVDRSPQRIHVMRGRPNQVIDGIGWVVGIPSKIALWDRRADNHQVSAETESELVDYMTRNDLDSALVRVNQYDPVGEWKRLAQNRRISAGWRYTFGSLMLIEYTLLPGRIMGEDWYNPFTDTINVYSDIAPLSMAEAAYAKDVQSREYPGPYAVGQELPVLGIWHETIATREVLKDVEQRGTDEDREEAYRILYPSYGGTWGTSLASFVPYGHVFGRLAGSAVGHAANGVRRQIAPDQASPPVPETAHAADVGRY